MSTTVKPTQHKDKNGTDAGKISEKVTENPVLKGWLQHNHATTKTVNANELTSITALIAYIAHTTNQSEFRIERQLADRFNIPNVQCLPTEQYDSAICYLVDQMPADQTAIV